MTRILIISAGLTGTSAAHERRDTRGMEPAFEHNNRRNP